MSELLKGAYDLHIHAAPDLLPRKMDDLEMADRALAAGMKGFAIKSHYFCTAERAAMVRKLRPGCNAVGTITLNSSVGGINPMAVEMAARAGARLVWFPTVDSEHEQKHLSAIVDKPDAKLPFWAKIQLEMRAEGVRAPLLNVLQNGKVTDDAYAVLDVIAKYDMILATAHISHEETFALVKAARERKVERIVITHVDFPTTFYSIEEQRELVALGAYMEHCYTTPATGKVSWEEAIGQIRAIGPSRVVLATDLGQPTAVYPDEGLETYGRKLLEQGFSTEDLRAMLATNPAALVE